MLDPITKPFENYCYSSVNFICVFKPVYDINDFISSFVYFFLVYSLKVKVHDLEQKCRTQSEQCNTLSKELEKYHLGSDAEDTLDTDSQEKNLCNSYDSRQRQAEKSEWSIFQTDGGAFSPTWTTDISECCEQFYNTFQEFLAFLKMSLILKNCFRLLAIVMQHIAFISYINVPW